MFVDPFEEVDIQVVLCVLQLMYVSMMHIVVRVSSYYCRWPNNGMEFIIKFIICFNLSMCKLTNIKSAD